MDWMGLEMFLDIDDDQDDDVTGVCLSLLPKNEERITGEQVERYEGISGYTTAKVDTPPAICECPDAFFSRLLFSSSPLLWKRGKMIEQYERCVCMKRVCVRVYVCLYSRKDYCTYLMQ